LTVDRPFGQVPSKQRPGAAEHLLPHIANKISQSMFRRPQAGFSIAILVAFAAGWSFSPAAAQDQEFARELLAQARVFPEIGPGVAALKRDSAGRYYVLAAPAKVVVIYGADGKRIGQIPNAKSRGAKIVYAQDVDIDSKNRLFVADRGANAVKVFETDGSLDATIPVAAPMSLAALPGGELAVAALQSVQLVSILDEQGKLIRSFGALAGESESVHGNQLLSQGRLYGDSAGHIYFVFTGLPDPTIRKYDRFGYAAYEISLPSSEFTPQAEARRWNSITIEQGSAPASTKPVIRALGVDPETQELWAAIGDELVHFDKDGGRRAAYRTSTKDGVRIEATAILVEHNRILLAADPLGVFDFVLPERQLSTPLQP
jgi:hypothetical protein